MDHLRRPESCIYRTSPRIHDGDEVAECSLLQQISGVSDHAALTVARAACEACCESFPPSQRDLNPVVASLLFELSEQVIESNGVPGCDAEKATSLNHWAEKSLPAVGPDEDDLADIGRKSYQHLSGVTADTIAETLPRPDMSPDSERHLIDHWAVGITTAPRRLPTVDQCVRSVIRAGWDDPVLFIDGEVQIPPDLASLNHCHRTPALGAFPNYVLSLAELVMRRPHADAYMIVQDDALFLETPAMREYLESVLWPGTGPCIASLYCSKKYNQDVPGWHKFPSDWVWGAVAFVFSSDAAKAFLASPMIQAHRSLPDDEGLSKIDIVIGQFASQQVIPILFPSPSLVQHIGNISTIWNVARAVNARHADRFIGDLI